MEQMPWRREKARCRLNKQVARRTGRPNVGLLISKTSATHQQSVCASKKTKMKHEQPQPDAKLH
jgi:hypothetical protein